MNDNNKNIFVHEWINKAADDELSINAILKESGAPSTACFLSQQMAEKYLKAFLVFSKKKFPKIHHLEKLLGMCKAIDGEFKELDNEAVLLSEYYIETRYPGDYPEGFSWDNAKQAYDAAIRIKVFVNERLNVNL